MKPTTCPIRLRCATLKLIKSQSLTFDAEGVASESYDEIVRRAIKALKVQQNPKTIDVSRI